jgi:hypothetical protein
MGVVRVRLALLRMEARLLLLNLLALCVLCPALPATLIYFAIYFAVLGRLSGGWYIAMLSAGAALLLFALWQRWRLDANELQDPQPFRVPLEQFPALLAEVSEIAKQLRVTAPSTVQIRLGPAPSTPPAGVLKDLVCAQAGEITLPVGCLSLWSVLEFRCHLARSLARRTGPKLLLRSVNRMMMYLGAEHYQTAEQNIESRRTRWIEALLERYHGEIARWQLLVECEADQAAAREYGAELVASWIRKTWQAEIAMPWYRTAFIEPAAHQAKLFPIGEGYIGFHHQMEPSWSEAEAEDSAEHSDDGAMTPVQVRIETLRHAESRPAVLDPRPAASVLPGIQMLEEMAVRRELDLPTTQQFRRLEVTEYAESVLLPLMRDDLDRNRHLLESKTVDDLPDLVNRTRELAELFAPKPLLLLDAAQKRVMVPDLLRSFLVVQLIDRGWQAVFSFWEGFRLTCGSVEIDPARVVYELGDGALSRDEFRALLTVGR